ncbi:MAG: porphobilinogen synthase [Deltaproteobacteria bacterium]|jgi:porphobilinogen synthase|nr:porphobilinogen synthase [Deltaproteobacteria bacterium]
MQTPLFHRGRRLRRSPAIRDMLREARLAAAEFVMPYFVVDSADPHFRKEIDAMPGQCQLALNELERQVGQAVEHGLAAVLLFGLPRIKDSTGSGAYAENGIVQQAIRLLKKNWPELVVITDVCLCEYTSHGHCGLLRDNDQQGVVLNDPTLELLSATAVSHAHAGADMIAPSDMMDGRILAIRNALDQAGFADLPIMSYTAKYASSFYGPFRDAADSAPQFGDRRTYQMDFCTTWEARREAQADLAEGADIVMVKPAGPYLDIIRTLRDRITAPIAAYQVSGEYAMIKAAGRNDWIHEDAVAVESLIAIRRAGAQIIISYFAEDFLRRGIIR